MPTSQDRTEDEVAAVPAPATGAHADEQEEAELFALVAKLADGTRLRSVSTDRMSA